VAVVSPHGHVTEVGIPGGRPTQIAAGRDGNGWFAQDETNQVGRITPGGQITEFDLPPVPDFGIPGETTDAAPETIAAGHDGRLWVGIANGIATITTAGQIEEQSWSCAFPVEPADIAAAPDGTTWTSEIEQPQIAHVDAAGNPTAVPSVAGGALTVAPNGAVSAFDPAGPTRQRIAPDGSTRTDTLRIKQGRGVSVAVRADGHAPGGGRTGGHHLGRGGD
jgi:streptogramin lyase